LFNHPLIGELSIMIAGCLVFVSEKFFSVFSQVACGWRFTSPRGWCAYTDFPASIEWIGENVRKALDTSENLNDFSADIEFFEKLKKEGLARNDQIWAEIRKAYGYRNATNARSSTWMVSVNVKKNRDGSSHLRVNMVRRRRNGSWVGAELNEAGMHVLLPLDASPEDLAHAVLAMLKRSTRSNRTMADVASAQEEQARSLGSEPKK